MSVVKAIYLNDGERYLGLNSDTKPSGEDVAINSLFEETDTGAIYKWNGEKWNWYGTAKALDHNRMMLGLGKSYKTGDRLPVLPSGDHAVYRFRPGGTYHHSEARILKVTGGHLKFEIYVNHNVANLPAAVKSLKKHNQKGLLPADDNATLTFDYHGIVDDAGLANILDGTGEEVDTDFFFAEPGLGQSGGTPESSALPSGRHYTPDVEYLVVFTADNGNDVGYFYTYFWHEG